MMMDLLSLLIALQDSVPNSTELTAAKSSKICFGMETPLV